jgi:hypothetical protein
VLAGMPAPIRRQLHRQIALHLEAQGMQGATVMRHWIEADDADRALPHAVAHMRVLEDAGMETASHDLIALDLLERAGDATVLEHVWVTVLSDDEVATGDSWDRLARLVTRVQSLSGAELLPAWAAHETARIQYCRDHQARQAYETLAPWAERLPAIGTERAIVEAQLIRMAVVVGGPAREHVQRFRKALEGATVPAGLSQIFRASAYLVMQLTDAIRALASDLRAARRRGDRADVADLQEAISSTLNLHGYSIAAGRHFDESSRHAPQEDSAAVPPPFFSVLCASAAGRFQEAVEYLVAMGATQYEVAGTVALANIWLRLGQYARAREAVSSAADADLASTPRASLTAVGIRIVLDELSGSDPLPSLRETVGALRTAGAAPHIVEMIEWQIQSRTLPLEDRLTICATLLARVRSQQRWLGYLAEVLLEAAQTHAEAHNSIARELALEAARWLRRRCSYALSLPEATLRCARLLEATDPAEAASLRYVARRWVIQALPHVPEDCLHSYVYDVPVHRELLGDDAPAAAAGTLRWSPTVAAS